MLPNLSALSITELSAARLSGAVQKPLLVETTTQPKSRRRLLPDLSTWGWKEWVISLTVLIGIACPTDISRSRFKMRQSPLSLPSDMESGEASLETRVLKLSPPSGVSIQTNLINPSKNGTWATLFLCGACLLTPKCLTWNLGNVRGP